MSVLNPEKLHTTFQPGFSTGKLDLPRRYTLTHSDRTGDLFLTVGIDYSREQVSGWYTRLMRDEALAELIWDGKEFVLHVYVHVSGGLVFGTARMRDSILHSHIPLVIEAIAHGDRLALNSRPVLKKTQIKVHFSSLQPRFNRVEDWGSLDGYT